MTATPLAQFSIRPDILCPRCGNHFNHPQKKGKFGDHTIADTSASWKQQEGIAANKEEVHHLEEEVRRLEDLVHHLHEDRTGLLRKLNSIQDATWRFPPEILSTIFHFARPPINFDTRSKLPRFSSCPGHREKHKQDDFQLVLGTVSHRWRQIAWATPELWTTISVNVYKKTCHNGASLLDLYFSNSRGFPMVVELDFRAQLLSLNKPGRHQQSEASIVLIDPVKNSVLNNAAKIERLLIIGLPVQWISLLSKDFTLCKSVTLYWSASYNRISSVDHYLLDLTGFHSLRHLCVRQLCTPFILLWPMITKLQVLDTPVEYCIELLTKCPNLIEFESDYTLPPSTDSLPRLSQPVVLEHLESLTWSVINEPLTFAFLRHIHFTKLRRLRWSRPLRCDELSMHGINEELLGTFFSNLPETLQVLELFDVKYTKKYIETILAGIPHLLELVISGGIGIPSRVVETIGRPVVRLTKGGAVSGTKILGSSRYGEGPKALPCLRKLTISRSSPPGPETVAEMLEALSTARLTQEPFRLELIKARPWEPEQLKRLKRLAISGFEFEIVQDSQQLD